MYRTVGFRHAGNLIACRINHQISWRLWCCDVWRERGFRLAWVPGGIGGNSGNGFTIGLWRVNGNGK